MPICAQNQSTSDLDSVDISLLTCSPHEEIYSLYGHSALRYHDLRTGEDVVLYAQWSPRDDTQYTIKHLLMTPDGDAYVEDVEAREIKTGTTDTMVTGDVKEYTGFKKPAKQRKNLEGDGQMVIEYKYDREQYLLSLSDEDRIETETPSGYYNYGKNHQPRPLCLLRLLRRCLPCGRHLRRRCLLCHQR